MSEGNERSLMNFSIDIRQQILRQLVKRGFGHLGGSMSVSDIVSVLYGRDMRIDPKNPQAEDRDLLVCSKGHAGPAIYAALALKGYFPEDWLDTLNQPATSLPSHCDRLKTPGIDMTTGSLGQGLSAACGMAYAIGIEKTDRYVYAIIGDGEAQEGQIWEAALFAAQKKLDRLILFLDYNGEQLDGRLSEINDLEDIEAKFNAFRWHTQVIDGHDHEAIHEAVAAAKEAAGKPSVIIAKTIKGYGCPFAIGKPNHHVTVSAEEAEEAISAMEAMRR